KTTTSSSRRDHARRASAAWRNLFRIYRHRPHDEGLRDRRGARNGSERRRSRDRLAGVPAAAGAAEAFGAAEGGRLKHIPVPPIPLYHAGNEENGARNRPPGVAPCKTFSTSRSYRFHPPVARRSGAS